MKNGFKTLASFFMKAASEPDEPETDVQDDKKPEDAPETENETEPEAEKPEAVVLGKNEARFSVERFAELEAAEKELKKFGATAADRDAFYAESKRLYVWYEGMVALGIKGAQLDAADEEKDKKPHKSAVTQEAEALQKKREK